MSYGTIQDAPRATGRAKVHFDPNLQVATASSCSDEDTVSEVQEPTLLEKAQSGLRGFYNRNFGLFLVFLSQTCGSIVSFLTSLSVVLAQFLLTARALDEHSSKTAHQRSQHKISRPANYLHQDVMYWYSLLNIFLVQRRT